MGASRYSGEKTFDCNWVDLIREFITVLGNYQICCLQLKEELDFLEVSGIVKDSLKHWGNTGITIPSHIHAFKSLALLLC